MKKKSMSFFVAATLVLSACENPSVEGSPKDRTLAAVKTYIGQELTGLKTAVIALQAAAPVADADGWNATDDAAAVAEMKTRWVEGRAGYERIEGAIAVLFPNYDETTDQRYDQFPDQSTEDNLFDGEGVPGIHAVERILWSDSVPAAVLAFEEPLTGYIAPAFPQNQQEAEDFKTALLGRLVSDCSAMATEFDGLALATETAYRGVLGSMEEQVEKVRLAGSGEDESRYSQHTLADMRFNLEGGRAIFARFEPMFAEKDGAALRASIDARFAAVQENLDAIDGDAIPAVPSGFDPENPGTSAYGKLFSFLAVETDPEDPQSFVSLFGEGATLLGIPALAE
jgi:iron uptake system component EfeO